MKFGFIDADLLDNGTKFPNLALMKLSGYCMSKGHNISLLENYDNIDNYDTVFISKVFDYTQTPDLRHYENVVKGGSGFFWRDAPFLPREIEHWYPNYDLYKKYAGKRIMLGAKRSKYKAYLDTSVGFLTRGCFRKCDFCINNKYDKVVKHSELREFFDEDRKYIDLLDDNFLGYSNWEEELELLIKANKKVKFSQGLDIRLMTDKKAYMLDKLKYDGDYTFAFDNIDDKNEVIEGIKTWKNISNKRIRLYVLVGFYKEGMEDFLDTLERIKMLLNLGCIPYIMKHKNYNNSEFKDMYDLLASWCNQRNIIVTKSLREFCLQTKGQGRKNIETYNNFVKKYPLIEKEYFNIKFNR